jgi:hypothetical protein
VGFVGIGHHANAHRSAFLFNRTVCAQDCQVK